MIKIINPMHDPIPMNIKAKTICLSGCCNSKITYIDQYVPNSKLPTPPPTPRNQMSLLAL